MLWHSDRLICCITFKAPVVQTPTKLVQEWQKRLNHFPINPGRFFTRFWSLGFPFRLRYVLNTFYTSKSQTSFLAIGNSHPCPKKCTQHQTYMAKILPIIWYCGDPGKDADLAKSCHLSPNSEKALRLIIVTILVNLSSLCFVVVRVHRDSHTIVQQKWKAVTQMCSARS